MNYALIENGIVTNLIWLSARNAAEFPNAVQLDDRPVAIGDAYADGTFYRDGEEVLTYAEILAQENADMQAALTLLGVNPEGGESNG